METWPDPLFACEGYIPVDAAAVELHRRRAEIVKRLRSDTGIGYAWDVEGAAPSGPAPADVSVMWGIRQGDGTILTGELRIPGERWDLGAFFAAVGEFRMSPAGAAQ